MIDARFIPGALGIALLAAADVVPDAPGFGQLANLSAVGVLGWWVWSMERRFRDSNREHAEAVRESAKEHAAVIDKLCERSDRWEQIRHEDNEKLSAALRDLTANCAGRQGKSLL